MAATTFNTQRSRGVAVPWTSGRPRPAGWLTRSISASEMSLTVVAAT